MFQKPTYRFRQVQSLKVFFLGFFIPGLIFKTIVFSIVCLIILSLPFVTIFDLHIMIADCDDERKLFNNPSFQLVLNCFKVICWFESVTKFCRNGGALSWFSAEQASLLKRRDYKLTLGSNVMYSRLFCFSGKNCFYQILVYSILDF